MRTRGQGQGLETVREGLHDTVLPWKLKQESELRSARHYQDTKSRVGKSSLTQGRSVSDERLVPSSGSQMRAEGRNSREN